MHKRYGGNEEEENDKGGRRESKEKGVMSSLLG